MPKAQRRRPLGSAVPVGAMPNPKQPARVSALSATLLVSSLLGTLLVVAALLLAGLVAAGLTVVVRTIVGVGLRLCVGAGLLAFGSALALRLVGLLGGVAGAGMRLVGLLRIAAALLVAAGLVSDGGGGRLAVAFGVAVVDLLVVRGVHRAAHGSGPDTRTFRFLLCIHGS